ncbi:thiosulfate reductase [Shewanella putrefaciens]|nr:thiosulfate reductase [Shewanella putrefaciens]
MRRALYAANVLIGNIERKGGIYIGQKPGDYNKLAGEAVAPVLAKPGIKDMPKPAAKRIDQVEEQYAMMWSSGGFTKPFSMRP